MEILAHLCSHGEIPERSSKRRGKPIRRGKKGGQDGKPLQKDAQMAMSGQVLTNPFTCHPLSQPDKTIVDLHWKFTQPKQAISH